MKILGIGWVGAQTDNLKEMDAFCEEVLGLEQRGGIPGVIQQFNLPNGDVFETMNPGFDEWDWKCPKADFLVEDVAATRAEMEAKGVGFIGPVKSDEDDGMDWTHFKAPDGHVYGLATIAGHPALKK